MIGLCTEYRGEHLATEDVDRLRVKMEFSLPLMEIVTDFFDSLKSITSGYGSFDYEDAGYVPSNLEKVQILLNGKAIDELSVIAHKTRSREMGKAIVAKLKDLLPRQQYAIAIQAVVRTKVLARENVKALRKDVTAKCYGGDQSRKQKLLRLQAKGKEKLKRIANIEVSKDVFVSLLKKNK